MFPWLDFARLAFILEENKEKPDSSTYLLSYVDPVVGLPALWQGRAQSAREALDRFESQPFSDGVMHVMIHVLDPDTQLCSFYARYEVAPPKRDWIPA
jgi:hypothetical protein